MRYLGGKIRQAPKIVAALRMLSGGRTIYREPFVGGGAVLAQATPHFTDVAASDVVPDLILLWQAVQRGWSPPTSIDRGTYDALRTAQPSALRAWCGFAASYNGKWFAGYGPTASGRDYLAESARAIAKKAAATSSVAFYHHDYEATSVTPGTVVYCDPPYASTEGYRGAGDFDHRRFWRVMDRWSDMGAVVCVSEYAAPHGWESVLDVARVETMNWSSKSSGARLERLFTKPLTRQVH